MKDLIFIGLAVVIGGTLAIVKFVMENEVPEKKAMRAFNKKVKKELKKINAEQAKIYGGKN